MKKKYLVKTLIFGLAALSLGTLNPIEANAEWRKNSNGWWYEENKTYCTGWKLVDNNWYYFDSNGYMETNNKIGDYFVNSTGVWTNEITAEEARQLILNEDKNFINEKINLGYKMLNDYEEYSASNMPYTGNSWDIPREPVYSFSVCNVDNNGEIINDYCTYLVGKESKNVYIISNQGLTDVYQIQDNKKVKVIPWSGGGKSYKWR